MSRAIVRPYRPYHNRRSISKEGTLRTNANDMINKFDNETHDYKYCRYKKMEFLQLYWQKLPWMEL